MTKWQPIAAAPKDGSPIIGAGKNFRGDWVVGEFSWHDSWYDDKSNPGWIIANCDEEYGCYIDLTHWQPLPEPPSE